MASKKMTDQPLLFSSEDDTFDWIGVEDTIQSFEEKGDLESAENAASEAVAKARSAQNGGSKQIAPMLGTLEARANFFARTGQESAAQDDFLEAISLVAGKAGNEDSVARLYGGLGYLLESQGKAEQAMDAYERSLEQLGRTREPDVLSLIRLSNNLAFLHSAQDDFDQAETLFLKALKLSHSKLGPSNEDTTGVCNNVGALYQKAGHLVQAREMHVMALEGREKSNGKDHPDTAQSHGNLAAVYAQEGKSKEAKVHFEASLKIFEKLGKDWAEDLDAVASNYLQLLKNLGEKDSILRVEKLLSKS